MAPRRILAVTLGIALGVIAVQLGLTERAPAPEPAAAPAAPSVMPRAPSLAAERPDPPAPPSSPRALAALEAAREPLEGERWLLSAMLAKALSEPRSESARAHLADLLLEARDLRGREMPGREREILLALNAEFERVAGEPMGNVASRLALPDEVPARAPPPLPQPEPER